VSVVLTPVPGRITAIRATGSYDLTVPVATVGDRDITLARRSPVRRAAPYRDRLEEIVLTPDADVYLPVDALASLSRLMRAGATSAHMDLAAQILAALARAGRLWLQRRLGIAERGLDLLERKLRILIREHERLASQAEQTGGEWAIACAGADAWTLRASRRGPPRSAARLLRVTSRSEAAR
jgi:hypothetical protein